MNTLEKTTSIIFNNSDITLDNAYIALNILNSRNIDFGDIFFQRTVNEGFSLEEGIIKTSYYTIEQGAGVRAVKGAKTGFAYTQALDSKSLTEACEAAHSIDSGRRCDGIEIKSDVKKTEQLYVEDNPVTSMDKNQKVAILQILDKTARSLDPRVTQVLASINCCHTARIVMPTDDALRYDIKPTVNISVSVIMEQNGKRESGGSSGGGAVLVEDLLKTTTLEEMAREAVRVAALNLDAIPAPAGNMPVVLGAGWPGVLIHEAVGHGLEGDAIRTDSSLFAGRLGQKVASDCCTVIDDGTIPNRRGSLSFDDEGTDTQCNVLIENGILKNYMLDKQNARLMGLKSSGNGRRQAFNCLTIPRMTNTYLAAGKYDKNEIIESVDKGIYAVNFNGGQVDIASGEFTFSASEAYLIENGKITAPIRGATLIGNGPETMKQISMVGSDLEFDKGIGFCGKAGQGVPVGIGQPTVKLDNVIVGGTDNG